MSLNIYEQTGPSSFKQFSKDAEQLNPVHTTHNGREGEVVERLLFLRNNDISLFYTNITLQPFDGQGDDDTIEVVTGWAVKLNPGSQQPTENEWDAITPGSSINMSGVGAPSAGDDSTFFPFWYRIKVPRFTRVQNKTDIAVRIRAVAEVVT